MPALVVAKARSVVAAAKPDDWQTPFQAANYAKANKAMDDAAKFYDQALKAIDEQIKAKANYVNLTRRANTLLNAGRTQEGIAAAEKAVEVGKAEKVDTSGLEKRIADLKAGT
jgi:tetratricopeptide (TPR) repeat protein